MNTFSMESVFLILSGVIFMAGILYWFWSHIQLTQKKVLLLESAVFELRSQMTRLPDPAYKPAYTDLADDWEEDISGTPVEASGSPVEASASASASAESEVVPEDLRPGGHVSSENDLMEGAPLAQNEAEVSNTQFRELFLNVNENSIKTIPSPSATATATANTTANANPESLDSMSLKELRRLAEQRGIPNPNELRKKEILSALRNQITPPVVEMNIVQENDAVSVTEILE